MVSRHYNLASGMDMPCLVAQQRYNAMSLECEPGGRVGRLDQLSRSFEEGLGGMSGRDRNGRERGVRCEYSRYQIKKPGESVAGHLK